MSLIVVAEVRLSIRVRTGRAALATTLAPDGEMSVGLSTSKQAKVSARRHSEQPARQHRHQ